MCPSTTGWVGARPRSTITGHLAGFPAGSDPARCPVITRSARGGAVVRRAAVSG